MGATNLRCFIDGQLTDERIKAKLALIQRIKF